MFCLEEPSYNKFLKLMSCPISELTVVSTFLTMSNQNSCCNKGHYTSLQRIQISSLDNVHLNTCNFVKLKR